MRRWCSLGDFGRTAGVAADSMCSVRPARQTAGACDPLERRDQHAALRERPQRAVKSIVVFEKARALFGMQRQQRFMRSRCSRMPWRSSGPENRSAASRAAVPSSTPRISMASHTSSTEKGADAVATGLHLLQEPLVGEPRQRTDGSACATPRSRPTRSELGEALPRLELPGQQHLAKPEQDAVRLGRRRRRRGREPERTFGHVLLYANCIQSGPIPRRAAGRGHVFSKRLGCKRLRTYTPPA